ncbi:MAG: RebB family R body protein [Alphaproteobacteria bacterium]|nr:RebB family R body protein [Alphaproteobacteria bacterium]
MADTEIHPEETRQEGAFAPHDLLAAAGTGNGEVGDVALAALSQAYAHTMSLAFHEAVLNQQRRSALAQAATARALADVQAVDAANMEEWLSQFAKGLEALGLSPAAEMSVFSDLTTQYQQAADQLMAVKARAKASG